MNMMNPEQKEGVKAQDEQDLLNLTDTDLLDKATEVVGNDATVEVTAKIQLPTLSLEDAKDLLNRLSQEPLQNITNDDYLLLTRVNFAKIANTLGDNKKILTAMCNVADAQYRMAEQELAKQTIDSIEKALDNKRKSIEAESNNDAKLKQFDRIADMWRVKIAANASSFGKDYETASNVTSRITNANVRYELGKSIGRSINESYYLKQLTNKYSEQELHILANKLTLPPGQFFTKREADLCLHSITSKSGKTNIYDFVAQLKEQTTSIGTTSASRRMITAMVNIANIQRDNGRSDLADKTLDMLTNSLRIQSVKDCVQTFKGKEINERGLKEILDVYTESRICTKAELHALAEKLTPDYIGLESLSEKEKQLIVGKIHYKNKTVTIDNFIEQIKDDDLDNSGHSDEVEAFSANEKKANAYDNLSSMQKELGRDDLAKKSLVKACKLDIGEWKRFTQEWLTKQWKNRPEAAQAVNKNLDRMTNRLKYYQDRVVAFKDRVLTKSFIAYAGNVKSWIQGARNFLTNIE